VSWSIPWLAEELAAVLRAREAALCEEQAAHGLDRVDERGLQALLAEGLAHRYQVTREVDYPSSDPSSKRSHRLACDLVLRDGGGGPMWLEVKVAHQFKEGGKPNGRYGRQWRRAMVADLKKLKADPAIRHAAIVLIAFTEDAATFAQDATTFERLLLDEELLCGWPGTSDLALTDRIGHRRCSISLWPLV
jgi:hypothetical protein